MSNQIHVLCQLCLRLTKKKCSNKLEIGSFSFGLLNQVENKAKELCGGRKILEKLSFNFCKLLVLLVCFISVLLLVLLVLFFPRSSFILRFLWIRK